MNLYVKKLLVAAAFVLLGLAIIAFSVYLLLLGEMKTSYWVSDRMNIADDPIAFLMYLAVFVTAGSGSLALGVFGIAKTVRNGG